MSRSRLASLAALLALGLAAGCASQQPALRSVGIGETFTLRVSESATVEPRKVVLLFSEVVNDSRCPAGVVCVWEGDAEISIRAVAADGSSRDLRLHTARGEASGEFAGLTIRLAGLEPAPREGTASRQADYRATLEVTESAGRD